MLVGRINEEVGMAEAEWLSCTDPPPMLEAIRERASARKLYLAGLACTRKLFKLKPAGVSASICANAVVSSVVSR